MTHDEYRAAYRSLGLSQAGAGRLLGVTRDTSSKWATGKRAIPPPVSRFLRYLVGTGAKPDDVLRIVAEP